MVNGWKVFAIILLIVVIAQSAFLGYSYYLGSEWLHNEEICSTNICSDTKYDSYLYDPELRKCYCYTNGVPVYAEVMP